MDWLTKIKNGEKNLSEVDLSGANLYRADLSGADLSEADLSYANLSYANLIRANLSWANLSWANLSGANFSGANFSGAYLSYANLSYANLSEANLSWANLREAYLGRTNLNGANLSKTKLPSPTMLLLVYWGSLSDSLATLLMRLAAANHPNPELFDEWAKNNGECPYRNINIQPICNFVPSKKLWSPGPAITPYEAMVMLIRECCVNSDYHDTHLESGE